MKNKAYFLTSIIIIISLISISLFLFIYKRINKAKYITRLKSNDYIISNDAKFEYFYEPRANNIEIFNPPWLGYESKNTINNDGLNDKFEVINLGVSGYDIAYSIHRFATRGIKYNPDLVVFLVINDNFTKFQEYLKPRIDNYRQKGLIDYPNTIEFKAYELAHKEMTKIFKQDQLLQYQIKATQNLNQLITKKLLLVTFPSISKDIKMELSNFIEPYPSFYLTDKITNIPSDKTLFYDPSEPVRMRGETIYGKYGDEQNNVFWVKLGDADYGASRAHGYAKARP